MAQKILLVEDDASMQSYTQAALANAGYEVAVCGTVAEARAAFRAGPFDLVLLDITLPDGNGLDLARELGLGRGETPFLFLTVSNDLQTRLEGFRLGAQDYISKPYVVEELLARVQAHLRLKQSRDDLARRSREIDLRQRAQQDLSDMIVHDLKAPLASIKGTLELAMAYGLITEPAYRDLLIRAGTAADFMLLMLNDLLDLGQAEEARLTAEIAPVPLEPLMAKLESLFDGHCRARGVRLETTVAPEAAVFQSDPKLLFRILVNLVSNALKASPRGETVSVEAALRQGRQRLTVGDRGPGVSAESKDAIFAKYATSDPRQGRGIGLTFCRMAAQVLQGDIRIEDRPGGGCLFVVEL